MMKRLLIFLVTGLAIVAANAPPADVTIGFIYVGQKVEDERSEQFEQAGQLSDPGRTDVVRSGG